MAVKVEQTTAIPIQPESNVYATYRRMAYQPWFAIGEFVDNSTGNFYLHRDEIVAVDQAGGSRLEVLIWYDDREDTLSVIDNANGMNLEELTRAIQLNRPPPDRSGRSEFGMGLKMAACWMGRRWRVITKRLGADVEYEAEVDIDMLEAHSPRELVVLERSGMDPELHYTRVEVSGLYRKFRGRRKGKIKEHLESIYRRDISSGDVLIRWNGDELKWDPDPVFMERLPDGQLLEWRKPVQFTVRGYSVNGQVWIRKPGKAYRAGMHLFRRGRIVIGGPGEGYKPAEIFGAPNSFESQRLLGELDLDNWPVTQTKDDFDWKGELEHEFVMKLKEKVSDYAEKCHRGWADEEGAPTIADGELAGDATKDVLSDASMAETIILVEHGPPPDADRPAEEMDRLRLAAEESGEPTYVAVGSEGIPTLKVWWLDSLSQNDPYVDFDTPSDEEIMLYVNLNHPFVAEALQRSQEKLGVYAQMLYVDALVERCLLKVHGAVRPQAFRRVKNEFLKHVKGS